MGLIMRPDEIERQDEALLVQGFTWREAASLTNEASDPMLVTLYARFRQAAGRVRIEARRKQRERRLR
jgi:hypothetical protein